MFRLIMAVALGSALGGTARFLIQTVVKNRQAGLFPWATWSINIIGAFLIGLLFSYFMRDRTEQSSLAIFLMTGVCGGFTTFSAFSLENMDLIRNGHVSTALIYILSSVGLGLLATYTGMQMMK
jgi:CrcB protein